MTVTWKQAWKQRQEELQRQLRNLDVFMEYCNRFLPHLATAEKEPVVQEEKRLLNAIAECQRELTRKRK
jgi:hypothetical protein